MSQWRPRRFVFAGPQDALHAIATALSRRGRLCLAIVATASLPSFIQAAAPSVPVGALQQTMALSPKGADEAVSTKTAPKQPAGVTRIEIPLRLERLPLGDVPAFLSAREELLAFDGPALLALLDRYVLADRLATFRGRFGPAGRLAVDDLRGEGIAVNYDIGRVEAAISIPLEMRTTQSLSLANPYGADRKDLLLPADVSGYVNVLGGHEFAAAREGPTPIVVDFDGALNVFGNVLEGLGTYRDIGPARWARGNTRLVRDDPATRTRLSVGDISYGLDGFQSFRRAGGISLARNFGLQPYRSSAPVGETDLNLDRNARVDVIVNGQRMRTIDLAAGRYNIRDLPLVGGTNDVTLRVVDEVGRVDVIRFPFIFDSTLLAAGEQDFGYAIGVPSEVTNAGRKYDPRDRIVSAFHTFGLTDQLTIGGNYQGSRTVNVVGAEGRWATGVGTFRADAAMSEASFAGFGGALRLQHRLSELPSATSRGRYVTSTATYRSPAFASLSQTVASNPVALSVAVLYGQRITGDLYGSLGVSHQFARDGHASTSTVDANLSMAIADDVTASLLFSSRQASFGGSDNRLFFALSWFPRGSGQRVGTSYDTTQRARRADWSYTPSMRVDALHADLSLSRDGANDTVDGEVGYAGYRFVSSVSHATRAGRADGGGSSPRTRVNFGTALAFAGGRVAVTRPINDSFALFVPHPTLSGQVIEVNRIGETPQARTDLLGSAVLPDLNSYYQQHVTFDAPDLPLGFELGRQVYDLQPTYRSGTVIKVGTGAVVLGDGILLDATGSPLPLEAGTIVAADDRGLVPIEFFTSRSGRFRVEGLSPGRFRLILTNEPDHAIEFLIPEGSVGRIDLGRLTYPITP